MLYKMRSMTQNGKLLILWVWNSDSDTLSLVIFFGYETKQSLRQGDCPNNYEASTRLPHPDSSVRQASMWRNTKASTIHSPDYLFHFLEMKLPRPAIVF